MSPALLNRLTLAILLASVTSPLEAAASTTQMFSRTYAAPTPQPGRFAMEATYHLWLPPGVKKVRAIIVHQHGCGDGAENSGATAALDLQWRALATKHDAALMSPHYKAKGAECRLWCDPRNGSGDLFLRALADLARSSGHPEIADAPWCLWGHSGGGFWASLMLEKHPDRIVAVACRSGAATKAWQLGEIPEPVFAQSAFSVPVLLNPGVGERGDKQFDGAWRSSIAFFELLRSRNAPATFAPDPFSGHDCRNSRLMAIPYFDACLAQRLPENPGQALRPINRKSSWWGAWENGTISRKPGAEQAGWSWLPDATTAATFKAYVTQGITTDKTPPTSTPTVRVARRDPAGAVTLEWDAIGDLESGVRQFVIYRDKTAVARLPETTESKSGYFQFQGLTYHDTPSPKVPPMRYVDTSAPPAKDASYSISIVNGAGLEGKQSKPVVVRGFVTGR